MSGDPQPCSSLISDGFEDDPPDRQTRLYAISGDFDTGYTTLARFCAIMGASAGDSAALLTALDQTEEFLNKHRDRYLLLETVELDSMSESTEAGLRACVEQEINACRQAGLAVHARFRQHS